MGKYTLEEIKANRKAWLDSLRYDELDQIDGQLADYDYSAFCCLGVAEDIVGPRYGISRCGSGEYSMRNPNYAGPDFSDPYGWYEDDSVVTVSTELHTELRRALGLNFEQQTILITLNDAKVSFEVIANVIAQMVVHFTDDDRGEMI